MSPRPGHPRPLILCTHLALVAFAAASPCMGAEPAPEPASERRTVGAIERALIDAGFENVTVLPGGGIQIAYENRRLRRSIDALAITRAAVGEPILAGERRLGLIAAAIQPPEPGHPGTFRVLYPSDAEFPATPDGPVRAPTFAHARLDIGALIDYRVGRIFDPMQVRAELEPRLMFNPWPGARVRLGVLVPLRQDFPTSELQPDLDRVRPGRASVDQFGWIPGLSLVSFSGGFFGDNRWGVSAGAARPFHGGDWLIDLQADRTGFLAFAEDGALYSPLDRTSGFAGLTWRPPVADVAVRARAGQFLYGDRGVDLEVKRTFGDVDLAYFVQRTGGQDLFGVRLDLPVPPMTRSTGSWLSVQPAPRFAMDFRDQDLDVGQFVNGVASREEFLRQLSRTSLADGEARYRARTGEPGATAARARQAASDNWVSFSGMTGFVNTPWAGVISDRTLEAGFASIPRAWAYDHRGTSENQLFSTTLGFLPRLETAMRWSRIRGYHSFQEIAPDSRLVDIDRMASARLALLTPRDGRPGVAIGIDDARGQRRFHSTYAVAGLPFALAGMHARVAAGYGFRILGAVRRVLNGPFGAAELAPWSWLRAQIEYDTEKWNAGLGLSPWAGLRLRTALLNGESLSLGAGWSLTL
ncbi:MAG TPA: YjbH domain-containing protein [Methylomirabilota bacterium]|nr:YjbH domain-containing protein [Methylomirabilota bacterium]